ncbi:RDD family protein [Cellulomonas sp. HZM]|uniref:RDD family protein n=1 Tax=Cellulomonas sp. HZM TaxID=1454010 RepID=UPI0006917081|nr:RDD family protein [Cellulomonas sp. HZM]
MSTSFGVPVSPGTVAPVGRRVLGYVIDGLVVAVVYLVALLLTPGATGAAASPSARLLPMLLALVAGVALWISESFTGATAGGALLGYRTLSATTGRPAGLLVIFLRDLVLGVSGVVPVVGPLLVSASGLFDPGPAQRGWHDKLVGTIVLRADALRSGAGDRTAAWDRAVERAVGGPAAGRAGGVAAGPAAAPARLPVVPPMPPMPSPPVALLGDVTGDASAGDAVVAVGAAGREAVRDEQVEVPADLQEPAPEPAAVRPRGGPVASAYAERLAAAAAAADDAPTYERTRAAHVDPPAPIITGYPGQASVPPVPRQQDLGDLEYTRMRESVPTEREHTLRLVFDTGPRIDVVGDGLVGRSPEGELGIVHVVVIDDPDRSVSKVHLAFGIADGGDELWVVDRGSVNGTVLVDPDGAAAKLPGGVRALVGPGWTIRFGQRAARVERR